MVVLDTNHLSALTRGGATAKRLRIRLTACGHEPATTVVCVEERIFGWSVEIRKRSPSEQIRPYREYFQLVETYARWMVLPWDEEAADLFEFHRKQGVRIGTMDLKIACIAIAHDALLLTQNSVDFAKVPGLRFEDWLVE